MTLFLLLACVGLDKAPPEVWLDCPPAEPPLSGLAAFSISAEDPRPGLGGLHVLVDEIPRETVPLSGALTARHDWVLDTAALHDGPHIVHVVAYDAARRENAANASCTVEVDNTPPAIAIARASRSARQGGTLAVFLQLDEEPLAVSGELFGEALALHRLDVTPPTWRALVGVPHDQPSGETPLTLRATDRFGNAGAREVPVTVEGVEFPYAGMVYLSPDDQDEMNDREGYIKARDRRAEAYATPIPDPIWSGTFQRPTQGRLTSAYGVYRAYNTGAKSYHTAIDIANQPGTPIYAANDGVVTLSEMMHTFGNAVVLGHGQGLSTSYSHLLDRSVEQGQRVEKGQLIGRMGSTGLSTGPHLHWGMIVHGVSVDASEWEARSYEYEAGIPFE